MLQVEREDEALHVEFVERVDDALAPSWLTLTANSGYFLQIGSPTSEASSATSVAPRGGARKVAASRQVALDEGQPVVVEQVLDREAVVVQQVVEDAHARPGVEEHWVSTEPT